MITLVKKQHRDDDNNNNNKRRTKEQEKWEKGTSQSESLNKAKS